MLRSRLRLVHRWPSAIRLNRVSIVVHSHERLSHDQRWPKHFEADVVVDDEVASPDHAQKLGWARAMEHRKWKDLPVARAGRYVSNHRDSMSCGDPLQRVQTNGDSLSQSDVVNSLNSKDRSELLLPLARLSDMLFR